MNKRIPILMGLILTVFAAWLLLTSTKPVRLLVERLENIGYDLQLRMQTFAKPATINSAIAIVDIDDKSLKVIGRWPWSRNKLALLVDKLKQQGAAVIAFDIFFSEPENNIAKTLSLELSKKNRLSPALAANLKQNESLFDEDSIFAKSLAENQSVLAIGFLPRAQTQNQLPPPLLTLTATQQKQLDLITAAGYISNVPQLQLAAKNGGFINIFPDNDGIIRHAPLLIEYQGKLYPSLFLQAVLSFLDEKINLITPTYGESKRLEGIQIGNTIIPTDAQAQVYIPFVGKSYTFPYYSVTDVLNDNLPKNALLGKIIFIGTSATGLGDLLPTAIQNPFPGVEIQATLVNGILENNFSYKPAWTYGANLFFAILFGIIATIIFPYLGARTLGILMIIAPLSLLFINSWIWKSTGLILSFLIPAILVFFLAIINLIYGYLFETLRRERLKSMFGQYVPAKHIDEMLQTKGDYGLRGEDREMSVLFADIRNFTSLSEDMPAAELVDLLNNFFTPMTEIIFKHRGTIDKYVGDLIMAFWGAPLKDKNHARHALQAALEMQRKMHELRQLSNHKKWPDMKIGIGLNSGVMSIGDMGSRFRRNYTVLGDAVNLASRIENLTKFYGVDIIVSEYTEKNQPKFIFRKLDKVNVKGKKLSLEIYELVCLQTELTPEIIQELSLYHQALTDYFSLLRIAEKAPEAILKALPRNVIPKQFHNKLSIKRKTSSK